MLLENEQINHFSRFFKKAPYQLNALHEADAELCQLHTDDPFVLAVNVDGIAEEIATGLYDDPYLIGWMCVTASLSDLAAVGAKPVGMVLLLQKPADYPTLLLDKIRKGIADSCREHETYILGGDTNEAASLSLAATSFGLVDLQHLMTRKGCRPGDFLYASGPLGIGNAFGFVHLIDPVQPIHYQPKARLKEGHIIKRFASCCIDTSDGAFTALAQLGTLNSTGFKLEVNLQQLLAPDALQLCQLRQIPAWMLLAGPHGEFELLFTIPPSKHESFLAESRHHAFSPLRLGQVTSETHLCFDLEGIPLSTSLSHIANLYQLHKSSPQAYFKALQQQHFLWKQTSAAKQPMTY